VDVRHLRVDEAASTGVMIRELRDVGPSEVIYWRAGSAGSRLCAEDIETAGALIDEAAWLHVTGITPALSLTAAAAVEAALVRARAAGATVSLDVNIRLRLWSEAEARAALVPLVRRCDLVLGSVDELAVVSGLSAVLTPERHGGPLAVADAILSMGPSDVVVRLGSAGAIERGSRGTIAAPALLVDRVVDPVGAGDAFSAGYIASRLRGVRPTDVLAAANACGAAVVGALGDTQGFPNRKELAAILRAGSMRDVSR
jgi:2-dehydro-3-deoxygluconokinase